MDRLIYTALSGATQTLERQAVVANNMANASTPGFRAQLSMFRAVPVNGDGLATRAITASTTPGADLSPGDMTETGRSLDVAIDGDGWLAVQRRYRPPLDARAHVRRMAPDGSLGPVLIELKLPGTTDNFEGIAAETRNGRTRLYILSDDNFNPMQRTLLLAFDLD